MGWGKLLKMRHKGSRGLDLPNKGRRKGKCDKQSELFSVGVLEICAQVNCLRMFTNQFQFCKHRNKILISRWYFYKNVRIIIGYQT